MIASEFISEKIQELLGENYKIFSNSHFNKNYTEARQIRDGEDIGYIRQHTSDYGTLRKKYVVGVLSLNNAIRSNTDAYYLTSGYKIEFSVPRNIVKTDRDNNEIEINDFDFNEDIQQLINSVVNQTLSNGIYNIKMTMSEPSYITTEKDGEYNYDIMQVSGSIIISDRVVFGDSYSIEFFINGEYVQLDGINTFRETYNTDNNAIVKQNTTKVEQNLSEAGWVCTFSIDDIETINEARLLIYDIAHKNREIINQTGETEALKRKIKVRIKNIHGLNHIFYAIISVNFSVDRNGAGVYSVSLTDDNKGITGYTLSFDSDGGSRVDSIKVIPNEEIGRLPTSKKEGNLFSGWTINDTRIFSSNIWEYDENKTAIANWLIINPLDLTLSQERYTYIDSNTNKKYSAFRINITTSNANAIIYYTEDGSMPKNTSNRYTGTIDYHATTHTTKTIKAVAYLNNSRASNIEQTIITYGDIVLH